MFEAWGRFVYRRRRLVLLVAAVVVAGAAAVWGTGVFGSLQSGGGFTAPGSQSQQASDLATKRVRAGHRRRGRALPQPEPDRSATPPTGRAVTSTWPRCRTARCCPRSDLLDHALAAVRRARVAMRPTPCCGWQAATDAAQMKTYQAISGKLGAPGLTPR